MSKRVIRVGDTTTTGGETTLLGERDELLHHRAEGLCFGEGCGNSPGLDEAAGHVGQHRVTM